MFLCLCSFGAGAQSGSLQATYCDGNPADWANFRTIYPIHSYTGDPANATTAVDNNFKSAKDVNNINTWTWWPKAANDKGDITNAGAVLTGTNNCVLRFFGDRTDNSGASNIGFWFFKDAVSLNSNGTFSGTHTVGDLLVVVSLNQGGVLAVPKVYEWTSSGLKENTTASAYACSGTNTSTSDVPAGLTYTNKDGNNVYLQNAFFEGAVDLCSAGLTTCFATFLVETRQSPATNAALEDFAIGDFNATPSRPSAQVTQPTCSVATGSVLVQSAVVGYTYTLTGTNPVRAAVSNATGEFTGLAPGVYSLTASQGTCTSPALSVTINPQPAPPARPVVTIQEATLCGSLSAPSLTVSCPISGATYELTQPNETPKTINYSGTGALVFSNLVAGKGFSVKVTNAAGCESAATNCTNYNTNTCSTTNTAAVQQSEAASDSDDLEKKELMAYPIPFSEEVTIEFTSDQDEPYVVNLFDMKGTLVRELKAGTGKAGVTDHIAVDGRGLAEGIYLVRTVSPSGSKTVKLLKKN